jgi:hypothetical protein
MVKNKISLRLERSKVATSACVVVSVPFPTNYWILDSLECKSSLPTVEKFDETAVAYSVYLTIYKELNGNVTKSIKNKVLNVCCSSQGGEFSISITCDRTFTAVRKCAGIAIANLKFNALYDTYSNICKSVGIKPNRDGFNKACTEMSKTLSDISVIVTGKFSKTDKAKYDKAIDTLSGKIKNSAPSEKGSARDIVLTDKKNLGDFYTYVSASGFDGVLIKNYIESNIRGIKVHLSSGKIFFPKSKEVPISNLADSDKVERFVENITKIDDELPGALVFYAACNCLLSSKTLKLSSAKYTEKQMKDVILRALK